MITVDNVTRRYPLPKRYREYLLRPFARSYSTAIVDANLDIHSGECLGLLGPNGAGKTTLLKLIGGLLYPTAGKITVHGHDTEDDNHQVRKKVGFVLNEERSFYWRLTGRQNLEFFGALDNLQGSPLRDRINHLLHFVGLDNAGETRVSNYSCGMRQRLAIARGLLSDPEVLILDEPTKSLDPVGAEQLLKLISQEIQGRHETTVLIATHRLNVAESICDSVCVITEGRIVGCERVDAIGKDVGSLNTYYRELSCAQENPAC